jgi:hypothetical protein
VGTPLDDRDMTAPPTPRPLRLLDLSAMVVAYGLAALLVRAFYPREGLPSHTATAMVAFVYAWLGLAMGGPMVLLLDRRSRVEPFDPNDRPRYTWAETAWLLIGGYWIGLAMFVVPSRLPINPLLGVFPIFGALAIRLFGRSRPIPRDQPPGWTHSAAVVMLVTWPIAWLGMMALGKSLS